jgi:hypothetical protein
MGHDDTFIVWIGSDEGGRMHGIIEHIASKEELAFMELDAMISFIRYHLETPVDIAENAECGNVNDEVTD